MVCLDKKKKRQRIEKDVERDGEGLVMRFFFCECCRGKKEGI